MAIRNFYPRSPCGERQHAYQLVLWVLRFLSTLSLRRATSSSYSEYLAESISIHALLAESDFSGSAWVQEFPISIHALLAESDNQPGKSNKLAGQFLSTLSLRRATRGGHTGKARREHFYPRSPCGERLNEIPYQRKIDQFLSTLSLRRATTLIWDVIALMTISIHALLAESDMPLIRFCPGMNNFYPRSPCGERRRRSVKLFRQNYISIHALLAESDSSIDDLEPSTTHFYPRSPCGERPCFPPCRYVRRLISIHALLAESDARAKSDQRH